MPLPVQSLSPTSSPDAIKQAIARSIEQCVNEGRPQDQCVAIAYRYAEQATGKSSNSLARPGMEWAGQQGA